MPAPFSVMSRLSRLCLIVLATCWSNAVAAAVAIDFYSKDFGGSFPHAFVKLSGTVDATGERVDTNYGFTAVRASPAVLAGPVRGKIQTVDPDYVARSNRHFTLRLTDDQYRIVLARIEAWRTAPQPSYRLNSRNCVHFVADVASALGLEVTPAPNLMKKPKSFLQKVTRENQALIMAWNGSAAPPSATATATAH